LSTSLGSPFHATCQVLVSSEGIVRGRGLAVAGAELDNTGVLCTVPVAARPSAVRRGLVITQAGALSCNVNTDGTITFPAGLSNGQWAALDSLNYAL
jgi:hypothetical protein